MLILDAVEQEAAARREALAAAEATVTKLRDELEKLDAIKAAAEVLHDPAPDNGAAPRTAPATPTPSTKRGAPRRSPVPPANGSSSPQRPAHGRPAPAGGRGATGPGPAASRADRIYDVIAAGDGPVSRKEIAAALGCAPGGLSKYLADLTDAGRIVRVGGLRDGGFQATEAADAAAASPNGSVTRKPLPVLIRSVMQTLGRDAGLTEQQLAQALDLDREDVAVTCGELLERGWVVLRPDGGYEVAPEGETTPDEQGGGHHAMTTSDACRVCGRELRGRHPGGLCGFCDPKGGADGA